MIFFCLWIQNFPFFIWNKYIFFKIVLKSYMTSSEKLSIPESLPIHLFLCFQKNKLWRLLFTIVVLGCDPDPKSWNLKILIRTVKWGNIVTLLTFSVFFLHKTFKYHHILIFLLRFVGAAKLNLPQPICGVRTKLLCSAADIALMSGNIVNPL